MTAIVSGNNLGLNLGSLASLGVRGLFGAATQGRNGERAYVNVSTGGLVLQDQDLTLVGRGPDALSLRTYNSQGTYDFDNGDGWTGAPYKSVERVSATTLRRTDADGSTCDYVLDAARGLYVAAVSPGSVADTIAAVGSGSGSEELTWTDGATGTRERYVRQGQGRALLESITDTSDNVLSFAYDANGLIETVTTSDGEIVRYAYDAHRQLTSAQSEVVDPDTGGLVVAQRVVYGYDAQRRLETVTVEVAPATASEAARQYVTSYEYEGTSTRVSRVAQSDQSSLTFTYVLAGGQHRVETVTDGAGGVTRYDYSVAGRTLVTDASGAATAYYYDGEGRLTEVRSGVTAANAQGLARVHYSYNASGDVTSIRDGLDHETTFTYVNDRLESQRDAAGNVVTRTYTALNQVETETVQVGSGVGRTARNVHDARGRLRFAISPEGRVTEYQYDLFGQQRYAIAYAGGTFDVSALGATDAPTEEELAAWALTQDRTRTALTQLDYDYRGQLTFRTTWEQVDAGGDGQGPELVDQFVYDHRGLLIQTITPDTRATTALVHDGMGRVISTLTTYTDGTPATATVTQHDDANGRTTTILARTQVDPATQQVQVIADGLATTSVYDRAGRLVGVVQSSGGAELGTTRFAYDAAGRLRMTMDPTGARSWSLYDRAGQKVGEVSATGRLTEYVYDAAGRVTQTIAYATAVDTGALVDAAGDPVDVAPAALRTEDPGQDLKSWSLYDDAGRLTWQVDGLGYVTRTEYDGASRILSTTRYATPIPTAALANGIGVTLALAPAAGTVQVVADDDRDRVTSNVYDGDGRLRATVDGEGYLTELRYDGAGRLVQTIAYASTVPDYGGPANVAARLATARAAGTADALRPTPDPAEDVSTFSYYDASGRKIGEVDGEGYLTEFVYDANGRRTHSIRYEEKPSVPVTVRSRLEELRNATAAHQTEEWTYDAAGRLASQTNVEGTETRYVYDAQGRLIETTVAFDTEDRRTSQARYDVQGRVTAELSAEGVAALGQLELELGRPLTQEELDALWASHATSYTYDAAGRRLTATDALGHRTVWFHDDAGRVRFAVNARGEVSETVYDDLGRVERTVAHATRVAEATLATLQGGLLSSAANAGIEAALAPADVGPLADSTTRFEYDAAGRLWRTTDAEGARTEVTLDAFGAATETRQQVDDTRTLVTTAAFDRRGLRTGGVADAGGGADQANATTRIVHDAFGRVTETEDANGNVRNVEYDRLGRVVHVFEPADDRAGLGRVTTYDAFGRVVTQVDVFGRETRYAYDLAERSVTTTTPEGVVVTVARERNGQTRSITDGNGNVTRFAYDRRGNLRTTTRTVNGEDVVTESRYDVLGRLEFSVDGEGHQVQYTYDAANRLLTRTVDPGGLNLVTGYEYDAKGLQVAVTDPRGTVTRMEFDGTGRVLTRTVDFGAGRLNLSTTFAYDRAGRVLRETDPAGHVKEYRYDRLGRRVETVVDPDGLALRTTYRYDDGGNVVASTDGNLNVTRYVYGAGDRLVYTVDAAGGVTKQEYDAAGRVARTTRYSRPLVLAGLPEVATEQQVAALISDAGPTDPPDEIVRRSYDGDGRLTRVVDGEGGVTTSAYDGNGNVVAQRTYANRLDLSTWDGASLPAPNAQRDRRSYTIYDTLGRAVFTVDGTGAVVAMTYDRDGNVIDRRALAVPLTAAELAAVEVLGDPQATAAAKAAVPQVVGDAVDLNHDDARDAHLRRRYDAANRLEYSVDGTGGVTRQFFDGAGNLVKQVAYAGRIGAADAPELVSEGARDRVNVFVFDAAGRATFAVDALGGVSRQVFDAAGNVVQRILYGTRIAAPTAGSETGAVADAASALDANAAVARRSSRSVYDAAGRQAAAVDASGAVVAFDYDGIGNIVATTSFATLRPGARPTVDAQGRLQGLPAASAGDRLELRAYDAAGRLVYTVDPEGYVTQSEYDGIGRRVTSRLYLNPTSGLAARATSGQIQAALDAVGLASQRDRFGYDAAGHVVRTTDSLDQVETSVYDGAGNLLEASVLDGQTSVTTTYNYDAAGRQVASTSPPAEVHAVVWNGTRWVAQSGAGLQQLVTRIEYDALGNVTARIEAAGRDEERVTRFAYDAMGRQERTTLPAVGVYDETDPGLYGTGMIAVRTRSETEARTDTSEVTYDVFGDAVVGTDVLGNRTYKVHDALGRVRYEIDALGLVTGYERNTYGDVVKLTRYAERPALTLDPEAPPSVDAVATALAALDHGGDRTITTAHDAMGRAVTVTQPAAWVDLGNGVAGSYAATTRNFYDAFGQVVRSEALVDPVAGTWASTEHRFDRRGREVTTIDALGYVTAQVYDAARNVTRRIEYATALTPPLAGADRLSTLQVALDDRRTDYVYDLLNRKTAETRVGVEFADQDFVVARRNLTTSYDYDRQGNVSRVVDPLGGERRRFHDALGRVRAETGPAVSGVDGAVIPLTRYGYDALGNVVVRTSYARGADVDPATGAVAETGVSTPALDRTSLTRYDARGNAIEQIDAGGVSHYVSYDAAGRAAKQWQGVTGRDELTGNQVTRVLFGLVRYDALGRVVATVTPASTSVVRGDGIATLAQDEAGTVTTRVSYNAFGEVLARSTAPDAWVGAPTDAEFFEYDAAGRVWRTNSGDGVVKVYLHDLLGRRTAQITSDGAVDLLQFRSASEVVGQAPDQLRISNYFSGAGYKVEQLQFSDGVAWEEASLASTTAHYTGTDGADSITGYDGTGGNAIRGLGGNDTLTGGSQADFLDGGVGADNLLGNAGDDSLVGDRGNDTLWGGSGNDTYVLRRGDGIDTIAEDTAGTADTIHFVDVASGEVTIERIGNGLVIGYGSADRVTIPYCFSPTPDSASSAIERIQFADGVTWERAEIVARTVTSRGTGNSDSMTGWSSTANTLNGLGGTDTLNGQGLADTLDGGPGDDILNGNGGADTLEGGTGHDAMNGGAGNDTYVLENGSGSDVIVDYDATPGNADTVQFRDVRATDVTAVVRTGNALILRYGTSDQVTVDNYFTLNYDGSRSYEVEAFQFSDGVTWARAEIVARLITMGTSVGDGVQGVAEASNRMFGLEGADSLTGGSVDDVIEGGSGDDVLRGNAGADLLDGGTGNDSLTGGVGNDTYVIRRGGGSDTINDSDSTAGNVDRVRFVGIASTEVTTVQRAGYALVLKYGGGDQLTVEGYFWPYDGMVIEQLEFANGVVWSPTDILSRCSGTSEADILSGALDAPNQLSGLEGSDTLSGGNLDDTLDGGAGDDTLQGGRGADLLEGGAGGDSLAGYTGSDVYILRRGAGVDTISDDDGGGASGDVDTVRFVDVASADVTSIERLGNDLVLTYGASDRVTVTGYFEHPNYVVERFEFTGGVTWGRAQILERLAITKGTAAADVIGGVLDAPNQIQGLEGGDRLYGGALDDVIDGGSGDDRLDARDGNDTYTLRRGSGDDVIFDPAGDVDTVRFEDVRSTELTAVERRGYDLVLKYGSADQVTIETFFSAGYAVERFVFADGVTIGVAEMSERAVVIPGNPGLAVGGTAGDDTLAGGDGDDTLTGSGGSDLLEGGAGNDTLIGGVGGDTYVVRRGSGRDRISDYDTTTGAVDAIVFVDVASTEVSGVERRLNDLVIGYGNSDQVTIADYFSRLPDQPWAGEVEQFRFADGVTWNRAQLLAQPVITHGTTGNDAIWGYRDGANRMYGSEGFDSLTGGAFADVLDGGSGNDVLIGGLGADIYVVRRGSGQDIISESDATGGIIDAIAFVDVASTEVTSVERRLNDLVIAYGATDQVTVAGYFSGARHEVERVEFADGVTWTRAQLVAQNPITKGTHANDTILGYSDGANQAYGGEGADYLTGGAYADVLDGGSGNDGLTGNAGADLLDGGAGNDVLNGGLGADTYVVRSGSGQDIIVESDATAGVVDTALFADVASTELTGIERRGESLVIGYGSGDQVTISDFFRSASFEVEQFRFSDGVTWTRAELLAQNVITKGTTGNDYIRAVANVVNRMHGSEGADTLQGAGLDDVLDGGPGNDHLEGNAGSDTYVFRRGSGADVILDNPNGATGIDKIVFEDVASGELTSIERQVNDLVLKYGAGDQVTVTNYFSSSAREIERFSFADGVEWTRAELLAQHVITRGTAGSDSIFGYADGVNRMEGSAGADSLRGGAFGDVLDGGSGDDSLSGGSGDDTYVLRRGSDVDAVTDYGGNDKVTFTDVLSMDVLAVERRVNDLVLRYGATDQVSVANFFSNPAYGVECVEFADGATWGRTEILARLGDTRGTLAGDAIWGLTAAVNRMYGLEGADSLTGGARDDLIDGGAGDDNLTGGAGDDTYVVGRGAGADRITDYDSAAGNVDTIRFDAVASADVTAVQRRGNDLVLAYGGADQVTVLNYFLRAAYLVERFEFADGVTWQRTEILARVRTVGTVGADTLTGNTQDAVLDDVIDAGEGNDVLAGGAGSDTYVLQRGAGIDRITEGAGGANDRDAVAFTNVSSAEAIVLSLGTDLVIRYGARDQVTVTGYFDVGASGHQVEEFRFADGVRWDRDAIEARRVEADSALTPPPDLVLDGTPEADTLAGGEGADRLTGNAGDDQLAGQGGNDRLVGSAGADVLDGGRGDDTLQGDTGNDTYLLRHGSGQDVISEWDSTAGNRDVVRFLDVASTHVTSVARVGGDLVINFATPGHGGGLRRVDTQYDLLGRVTGQVLPERVEGATVIRPVVTMVVDRWGNITRQHDVRNPEWVTTYRYDANDKVVEKTQSDGSTVAGVPGTVVTRLAYDALGRQVMVTDANLHVNRQRFDAAGNLVQEIHADCRPVTAQVPDGQGGTTTVQTRDASGQLQWESDGTVTRRYNAFGELTRLTDAMGHSTEFGYDALGRNDTITSATTSVYTVGANDQLSAEERRALVTVKQFDEAGRLVAQMNGANETTEYDYDLRGNLVRTREPMGEITRSAFDVQGKEIGNLDANGYLATWAYDAFGRLQAHVDLGGETYSYTYDRAGQLVFQGNTRGQAIEYRYDGAGQVTSVHAALSRPGDAVTTTQDTTYAYYASGQRALERTVRHVTQDGVTTDVVDQDQELAYDALGRLRTVITRGALQGVSVTFRYDAVGNRMQQTNEFSGAAGAAQTQNLFYAYDEMNRQILVDGSLNNNATDTGNILNGEGHILAYDKAGNRISDTAWRQRVRKEYYHDSKTNRETTRFTALFAGGSGAQTEYYEYDELNRLTAIKRELPTIDYWALTPNTAYTLDARKYDGASRLVESGPGLIALHPSLVPALLGETWAGSTMYMFSPKDDADAIGARTRRTQYDASGRMIRQVSWKRELSTSGYSGGYSVDQILAYSGNGYSWTTTERVLVPDPVTGELVPVQKVGTGDPLFEADGVTPIYEQLVENGVPQYESVPVYTEVQAHNADGSLIFRNGAPILVPQTQADGSVVAGRFVQQVVNGEPQFEQVPVYEQLVVDGVLQYTQGAPRYVQEVVDNQPQYDQVPVYEQVVDFEGRPVFDATGNPVYVRAVNPDNTLAVDDRGRPVYVQARDEVTGALLFQERPRYVQRTDFGVPLVDAAGRPIWQTREVVHNASVGYDAVGNITDYDVYDGKSRTTSHYHLERQRFDGYRDGVVTGQVGGAAPGTTTSQYDANGFLVGIDDATKDLNDRTLANDVNGLVLTKKQGDHVLRQLVVNGNVLGVYGNGVNPADPSNFVGDPIFIDQRDLNRNFQPFTGSTPSSAALDYSVRAGDTLQGIARAVYGDATLWYLIADANGLLTDVGLQAGQSLTVPARAAGISNGADTFRPYDPSEIVGGTSPNLPSPKPKKKCDWVQIIVIVVIVVAISVATYGVASAAATSLGAGAITAGAVGGAAAGAAASASSQLMNGQDFSWRDVGMAALAGGITGGITGGVGPDSSFLWSAGAAVTGSVVANAAVQLHNMTYGTQKDFNWWAVASAAAAAGVSAAVGAGLDLAWSPGGDLARLGADVVKGTLTGVAAGVSARLVNHLSPAERNHKVIEWDELWMMTADSFGNALGNSTAKAVKKEIQRAEDRERDWQNRTLRLGGKTAAELGLDRRPGDQFKLKLGAGGFDYGDESAAEAAPGAALASDEAVGESSPPSTASSLTVGAEGRRGYWGVAESMLGEGASNADIQRRAQELMSANRGVTTLREGDVLNLGNGTVSADASRTYAALDESYQAQRVAQREQVGAALQSDSRDPDLLDTYQRQDYGEILAERARATVWAKGLSVDGIPLEVDPGRARTLTEARAVADLERFDLAQSSQEYADLRERRLRGETLTRDDVIRGAQALHEIDVIAGRLFGAQARQLNLELEAGGASPESKQLLKELATRTVGDIVLGASQVRLKPSLRRIHSESTYANDPDARRSLEYWRTRPTEEIVESLKPTRGNREALRTYEDGRMCNGNTRTLVLQERGVSVDALPREVKIVDPKTLESRWEVWR